MKLSDLLQVQPRITLALVEESAEMFRENGKRRGRDAERYAAALTYVYETSENTGLGLTVECVATIDRNGIARLVEIDMANSGREVWAVGVDELKAIANMDTHWVGTLNYQMGKQTVDTIADLFEKTPFKDTKTFMLEWI